MSVKSQALAIKIKTRPRSSGANEIQNRWNVVKQPPPCCDIKHRLFLSWRNSCGHVCCVLRSKPITVYGLSSSSTSSSSSSASSPVDTVNDHAVLVSDVVQYHLCVLWTTLTTVPDSVAQVDDHSCNTACVIYQTCINKCHYYSVSQKTGPLQLISHNFISS